VFRSQVITWLVNHRGRAGAVTETEPTRQTTFQGFHGINKEKGRRPNPDVPTEVGS